MIGIGEILILIIVAGIIFFGGQKMGELARSLGRFTTEFKKGKMEAEEELKKIQEEKEKILK